MSKTNDFETAILQLVFENTDLAAIGDGTGLRGSSTAGSFYVALFTGDPTDTGSPDNEATYTSYARKAVARSGAAWTTTTGVASNDAEIAFDACTGGTNTITHFAICKAGTASILDLIYYGALSASLAVSNGITPTFAIGAITVTEG